jgi:tetratricopeptide (TPR) repeat protein
MEKPIAPDIQEVSALSKLTENRRRFLQARLQRYFFGSGDVIIEQGRRGQFMGIVGHGLIDLESEDGEIRTLLPGQIMGEEMMIEGAPSPYKATARSDSSLWVLTRANWLSSNQIRAAAGRRTANPRINIVPILVACFLLLLILSILILSPELPILASNTLTRAMLNAGHPDFVDSYLDNVVKVFPGLAVGYDELGYSLYLQGKNKEAGTAFEKAVKFNPDSASAQNNLGVVLMQDSKYDLAIEHLKMAAESDPGNAEIFFNLGNAYLAIDDRQPALDAYRRAAELGGAFEQANVQLANLLMKMGELSQAKMIWEQILVDNQENASAHRGLGIIAVLEDRPKDSLDDLRAALSANPLDATAHLYLGLALKALDQPSEATIEFAATQMLSNDPAVIELAEAHLQDIAKNTPP